MLKRCMQSFTVNAASRHVAVGYCRPGGSVENSPAIRSLGCRDDETLSSRRDRRKRNRKRAFDRPCGTNGFAHVRIHINCVNLGFPSFGLGRLFPCAGGGKMIGTVRDDNEGGGSKDSARICINCQQRLSPRFVFSKRPSTAFWSARLGW